MLCISYYTMGLTIILCSHSSRSNRKLFRKLPTSHPSKYKTEHPKFFRVLTQTSLRCMFTFWNWTIAILCHLFSTIPCLRGSRFGIRHAHPEDVSSKPLKLKPLSWWIKVVHGTKLRPKLKNVKKVTHLHRGDVSSKNVKETIRGSGTCWFLIVLCRKCGFWMFLVKPSPPSIFSELSPSEIMVEDMLSGTFVIMVKFLAFNLSGFRPAFILMKNMGVSWVYPLPNKSGQYNIKDNPNQK